MDDAKPNPLKILLEFLDSNELTASDKYLTLHLKITKILIWKGCPEFEAENLADKVLDLIAKKISEIKDKLAKGLTSENGKEIKPIENINAYSAEVARFVWLEYHRKHLSRRVDEENQPETAVLPEESLFEDPDLRVRCLRKCIAEKIPDETDKQLILGYYDDESDEKNKIKRKALAEKLGITMVNLKVKACRLRDRLEKCINDCVGKLTVTKSL